MQVINQEVRLGNPFIQHVIILKEGVKSSFNYFLRDV